MRRLLWMLLAALACVSGEYLMGGHLDNNARSKTPRKTHLDNLDLVAEESTVAAVAIADDGAKSATLSDDEGDAPRYHVPYSFAFNGGKPFSLEKDPITGKIDFEKTPLVKPLNYTDGLHEDNEKNGDSEDAEGEETKSKDHDDVRRNEITQSHYFLPTHYSSDKYQYPLISSSYANTKVQSGANSYNHRLDAENDVLYARPSKNPYLLPTKTSTHKTTTAGDYKARWTSPPTITTTTAPSTTAANSQTTFFTKTPNITTWKPSSTSTAFHTAAEMENEKNLLPIEKLHASGQAASQRNPSNSAPTRSPNDAGTTTQKAQSNPEHNLVGSHARPETKPPAQNDEYNLYDIYDLSGSESEEEDTGHDNKEIDYLLPFQELLRENVTSTSSATIISSRPATSATTTTATAATTIVSSTGSTTSTTVTAAPQPPPRSSTPPPAPQENVFASIRPLHISTIPQYPVAAPNNDRRPSLTDHHDSVISHVYRPGPMMKPDQNRIESTSNIVIPPDQNTVSFVLGNRQNVDGSYHSVGTAVGENLFGTSADILFWPLRNDQQHGPVNEVKYEHPPVPSVTQKWPPPASGALKGGNELDPTRPQNSGIVPPETTQGNKDSDYVNFPDDETNSKGTEVIVNEADGSIPITTVNNDTKLAFSSISENLPQLAQDLMPPAKSTRPPQYYYHYQYDTSHPDHLRPQRLPPPPRVKPHPGVLPLDPRKRPYSPDTKLPNILPQFRPNAKTSHGHRGPDAIGTMPAGQGPPARIRQPLPGHSPPRRPFPLPPPSYLQRLNPPPPPIHAVRLPFVPTSKVEGVALPHEAEPTIRRFVSPVRPPHAGAPPPVISHGNPEENALSNRLFGHGAEERNSGGEASENRKEDRLKSELEHAERYPEHENAERYPEEPPMTPPRPPLFPKRRTADPPRVTTLQMLQQHGELNDEEREEAPQAAEAALAHEMERRKSDDHDPPEVAPAEQPVYVVYPVNTAVNIDPDDSGEKDGSVVVGTRGPQRPLPPDTLLQDEREETHAVYHGKPVAADFPYLLERPDPSSVLSAVGVKESPVLVPSDQWQQASATAAAAAASEQERNEQDAVNVIPYLQDQFLPYRKKSDAAISVTLHRAPPTAISTSSAPTSTPTPIAYVYTPTQAAHRPDYVDVEDDAAVDVKQMVLLPSQQPSSSSSSAPAPQNFMAPFVASMSAEAPSKNGWNVVVVNPPAGTEKKSDSDVDGDGDANPEAEYTQTEKNEFDADNFKPQLFGGFKPIYQFPKEDAEQDDVAEQADAELNMPRHSKELPAAPDGR